MNNLKKSIKMTEKAIATGKLSTMEMSASKLRRNNIIQLPGSCSETFGIDEINHIGENCVVLKGYLGDSETELVFGKEDKVTVIPNVLYYESPYSVTVSIQPIGFWTSAVTIRKELSMLYNENDGYDWKPADISWGSGGTTGQLNSQETAKEFKKALTYAIKIARDLDKRFKN